VPPDLGPTLWRPPSLSLTAPTLQGVFMSGVAGRRRGLGAGRLFALRVSGSVPDSETVLVRYYYTRPFRFHLNLASVQTECNSFVDTTSARRNWGFSPSLAFFKVPARYAPKSWNGNPVKPPLSIPETLEPVGL
jgi:hypothetical protein